MELALSILPVFLVIGLGVAGARLGLLPQEFLGPANRLAFYLAIPALIFRVLARVPWHEALQPGAVVVCLSAMLLVWISALLVSSLLYRDRPRGSRATFVHSSVQGNQGFLGLAVIFYALGDPGIQAAGVTTAAVILLQNVLGVTTLTVWGEGGRDWSRTWRGVAFNPVIIAALAGVGFSLGEIALPVFLDRTLMILGNLGLPLALLIVGATLSNTPLASGLARLTALGMLKLMLAPALGLGLLLLWPMPSLAAQSALILLAAPTATVTVILGRQMGGDMALASSAVSFTHALSPLTYYLWLYLGRALL